MDAKTRLLTGKGREESVHLPTEGFAVEDEGPVEAVQEGFDVREVDDPPAALICKLSLDVPELVSPVEHLQKRQGPGIDGDALIAQIVGVLEYDHPAALDEES